MKIFCINLERATERKLQIQKNWIDNLKLDIFFWPAYDKIDIEKKEFYFEYDDNLALENFKRSLSSGEIACATSFYQLFNFILKNNIKECIIMEDDIHPLIKNKKIIFENINKCKKEFINMQMLLMHKISKKQKDNCYETGGATCDDIFSVKKSISSMCKVPPWGNQFFYITRKAIEIAYEGLCIKTNSPIIWHPADYFSAFYLCPRKMVCILNEPICFHPDEGATTYIGNDLRNTNRINK